MIVKTFRHSDGSTVISIPMYARELLGIDMKNRHVLVTARIPKGGDQSKPAKIIIEMVEPGTEGAQLLRQSNRSLIALLPGRSVNPIVEKGLRYLATVDEDGRRIEYELRS